MPGDRELFGRAVAAGVERLRSGSPQSMANALRTHLAGHVMPFWENHAWEETTGSLCTCIGDDGVVKSRDKWLWSQWRAVWIFSRLHRTMGMGAKWLERAERIAEFCGKSGWLEREGGWALLLDGDGKVLRGHESTYTDAFALLGLAELHRSLPSELTKSAGRRTAQAALRQLAQPYDTLPHFPYPVPQGAKPHGVPMMWSHVLSEAGDALGKPEWIAVANRLAAEVMRDFARHDDGLIVEFVRLDGSPWPAPRGTAVVPGHAIESMWFQLRLLEVTGGDPALKVRCTDLMRRHLEFGWDLTHGGLLLARDADGRTEAGWDFSGLKLWWPHTEALYGALLAWTETGDGVWLDWYEKLWSLCLERFVDWEHGEWRQKLNRDLTPWEGVVALPVKDPFHLPRSLILQIELLERLARHR